MFASLRKHSDSRHSPTDDVRIETDVTPIAAPQHPQSLALLDFWTRHRQGNRLLSRAALPCREMSTLLPSVFVLEPLGPDGADWRLRLIGTQLTGWLGFDPTGKAISELYQPDCVADNAEVYRQVTSERIVHATQGRLCGINRDFLALEILHLPMEGATPQDLLLLGSISIFPEENESKDGRQL
ncbi:PAS domain-containing protein [Parvibaculum sp.]|uniref:PAS domain-containing protein n=1 Tax=Parvibaculum sp. TaxID=2024848 RepID=UPI0034A07291